jgi:SAM-dependent methyltransferase
MPTVPPAPKQPAATEPHEARRVAESFGTDAQRYDRARPRYPEALFDRLVARSPGRDVLDVGCGTGIVARQLEAAGCRVLGVEPDARMAAFAQQHGLEVETAKVEDWDPAGRAFDAVVVGQAWHWVDPVAGAAKAAEVLRPGGVFAAFWNAGQIPQGLTATFDEINRDLVPEWPRNVAGRSAVDLYTVMCSTAADGLREVGAFSVAEQWRFDWEHLYTKAEWLDVLPTQGFHTRLSPEVLAQVLARVGDAIDAVGGSFRMNYATVAVVATRRTAD